MQLKKKIEIMKHNFYLKNEASKHEFFILK